MTTTDKAKNAIQQAKGRLKEAVGDLSGNDDLWAEGQADQTEGALKLAGEKVKDAFTSDASQAEKYRDQGRDGWCERPKLVRQWDKFLIDKKEVRI